MKILITGGFGFVGGRLAQYFSTKGHEIFIGSRHFQENPNWCKESRSIIIDWHDPDSLELATNGIDCIVHAAGMNAQDCERDPVGAIFANGVTTAKLIEAAVKNKVKKFIYISSMHVYNSHLQGEIIENLCATNLHPYATSHKIAEDYVLKAHSDGVFIGIAFRLSNSFGRPAHKNVNVWKLLINDLCKQCVSTGKIILHSNGKQYRDFISLDAVCKTIEQSITKTFSKDKNTLFNLCSGKTFTVLEMAELVAQRYEKVEGNKISIQINEEDNYNSYPYFNCSTKKLEENYLLNSSDFDEEIDKLIQFCKMNFSKE